MYPWIEKMEAFPAGGLVPGAGYVQTFRCFSDSTQTIFYYRRGFQTRALISCQIFISYGALRHVEAAFCLMFCRGIEKHQENLYKYPAPGTTPPADKCATFFIVHVAFTGTSHQTDAETYI